MPAMMLPNSSLPRWPLRGAVRHAIVAAAALVVGYAAVGGNTARADAPDFNRQVRPILAKHCLKCHGPDDHGRQGGLRLDQREAALRPADSGELPLVPGQPDQSEVWRRVTAEDESLRMPPAHTKDTLTPEELATLRAWIAAGAEYRPHWAFEPVRRPELPAVERGDWVRNPVDRFILAEIERAGLAPSPEADRATLLRRVYLDLIGLPPTPEEADEFFADRRPDAYERLVERLLASPHYGERWARRWLDLARYADTNGYEKDRPRSIWPYRDWVIRALNADLPFDQFTIEQLAGDLLPGATAEQRIATGFHRNTMLNEEGGIDPLEYRFYSMTDRVATTGTVWLGLTLQCAQCHTHKFDPIPHREYYQFMALLNNADEPELETPTPEQLARRAELEAQRARLEATLDERFPLAVRWRWHVPAEHELLAVRGPVGQRGPRGEARLPALPKDREVTTLVIDAPPGEYGAIRLELPPAAPAAAKKAPAARGAAAEAKPPRAGALAELRATVEPRAPGQKPVAVALARVETFGGPAVDESTYDPAAWLALDGDAKTSWSVRLDDPAAALAATFVLERPAGFEAGSRWTITLEHPAGQAAAFDRLRIALGQADSDPRPEAERRRQLFEERLAQWTAAESARAVAWQVLRPASAESNLPLLTVLDDDSILSTGDISKRDVYTLKFATPPQGLRALRLEALPDVRLPKRGPGRIYYEGPLGDFFLSEIVVRADGAAVKLASAAADFAGPKSSAAAAIDGDPATGWTIDGAQGQPHRAVVALAEPLGAVRELTVELVFEKFFAAGLGRFRISAATEPVTAEAARLPVEVEAALARPTEARTAAEVALVRRQFLLAAPELAAARRELDALRRQLPAVATTMVFEERPPENPRPTFLHHRGEFLQPKDRVEPAVLGFLPKPAEAPPTDRLGLARWLVDPRNPLTSRVTANRQWAILFGRGLVATTEDFGYQGAPPTHPELLDWLAAELMDPQSLAGEPTPARWSLKHLHRVLVTSATYRQSSDVAPPLRERDPENLLWARAPRYRLDAELVRDAVLRSSGLLSPKLGGPSVFPPQPESVTTEGAYGQLTWKVSEGEDRYRRSLYTFSKRTAPFAMFATFDAPSGEACVARREVSNTPLQALTLLNDAMFMEAARALGARVAQQPGSDADRARYAFRRVLTREPKPDEQRQLVEFFARQRARLAAGELKADELAAPGEGEPVDKAAWTLVARALFNLDETVTRP